jgi:hypothetical protein
MAEDQRRLSLKAILKQKLSLFNTFSRVWKFLSHISSFDESPVMTHIFDALFGLLVKDTAQRAG